LILGLCIFIEVSTFFLFNYSIIITLSIIFELNIRVKAMNRYSGLFLHPTSMPSRYGIGDLGDFSFTWIDMLSQMKQSFWQLCPLGPTGFGDSPYQCFSSFAGNPLLISPDSLEAEGLLTRTELENYPRLPDSAVDFAAVIVQKEKIFRKAYSRFTDTDEFIQFCENERYWLDDYALFRAIKDLMGGKPWYLWDAPLKMRDPAAIKEISAAERNMIRYQKFLQFCFYRQWTTLKSYANKNGVRIIGDIPYYTAYDSSDVWAAMELFELDESGKPLRVAGVPPDYFSENGQLWGNPLYRWDKMRKDGYSWWIKRIQKTLQLVDYIRLDHFRGFEAFWAIPFSSNTAKKGVWVKGPGIDFFNVIKHNLGKLPIIAEDLGDITQEVELLRQEAGLHGMKVLQFAFDGNPHNPYLPYNIFPDSVTYTGTHDNDTSLGWYNSLSSENRIFVHNFLGCNGATVFLQLFLRLAFGSPSRLCIIPFQDVLGLGTEHRMNTPGTGSGNWKWRFTVDQISKEKLQNIRELTNVFGRAPEKKDSSEKFNSI